MYAVAEDPERKREEEKEHVQTDINRPDDDTRKKHRKGRGAGWREGGVYRVLG